MGLVAIGRLVLRALWNPSNIETVHINIAAGDFLRVSPLRGAKHKLGKLF